MVSETSSLTTVDERRTLDMAVERSMDKQGLHEAVVTMAMTMMMTIMVMMKMAKVMIAHVMTMSQKPIIQEAGCHSAALRRRRPCVSSLPVSIHTTTIIAKSMVVIS